MTPITCQTPGCGAVYERTRKPYRAAGTPFMLTPNDLIDCPCGCLLWRWGATTDGYPQTRDTGGAIYVQPWLLDIIDRDDVEVCHLCRNKRCMSHIRADTHSHNTIDQLYDGTHVSAKLSPEQVLAIRECLARGERQQAIADDFGISQPTVSQINTRTTWNHCE